MTEIGLSRGDFLALQPVELMAMLHRHRALREEERWRDATLMACIVNSGLARPKDGVKPSDFMPQKEDAPRRATKRMTAKRRTEVADGIRALMAQHMAKPGGGGTPPPVDGK